MTEVNNNSSSNTPVASGAIQRVVHAETLPVPAPPGFSDLLESHKPGLLRVLWHRKWLVLAAIVLSVSGGVAYARLATPIYVAYSRIYVTQSGPRIMGDATETTARSGNYLSTECQVIQSGDILTATMNAPGIRELRTFADGSGSLTKNLTVTPGKYDDLITISFESPYPKDTAEVVNALVNAYIDYRTTSKKKATGEILDILMKEKKKRDGELEAALTASLNYRQSHPELGFQGEKGNIIIQRLDQLSTAVTGAEIDLAAVKSAYEAVESMKDDPAKLRQFVQARREASGVYIAGQDEDAQLRSELNSLKVQLRALSVSYDKSHRTIEYLEKRIAEANSLLSEHETAAAAAVIGVMKQQYDSAQKKMDKVKASYDEQMQAAMGLNRIQATYAGLQNDWERLKQLVESLDKRIKELNVTEDVRAMNISVLEPAREPSIPSKPDQVRAIGIAAAIGLLLGIGLAMLRNLSDPRVRSADEVAGLLGVPVVGVLPRIKGRPALLRMGRNVLEDPMSPVAEAYRGIRTALSFGLQGTHARTVLITSPAPGDGKSSLISNLAITMAQAGQRTLVMDADMLSPKQHVIFGIPNDMGLANVLSGEVTLEQAIHRDGDHGPDILPSGRVRSHTSELLNGRAFVDAIRALSETYDQILIDSPPLMSVTDPLVLAAISDVTILVLRAERCHRKLAEQARAGLASVGARVFGAVVNDVKGRTARYGGHYRYYAGRHEYAVAGSQEEPAGAEKT